MAIRSSCTVAVHPSLLPRYSCPQTPAEQPWTWLSAGGGGQSGGAAVRRRLVRASGVAGTLRCWLAPRLCGGLLGRVAGSISIYLVVILVPGPASSLRWA